MLTSPAQSVWSHPGPDLAPAGLSALCCRASTPRTPNLHAVGLAAARFSTQESVWPMKFVLHLYYIWTVSPKEQISTCSSINEARLSVTLFCACSLVSASIADFPLQPVQHRWTSVSLSHLPLFTPSVGISNLMGIIWHNYLVWGWAGRYTVFLCLHETRLKPEN